MRRALFNKIPVRYILNPPRSSFAPNPKINNSPFYSFESKLRFFSTQNKNPATDKSARKKKLDVKDVSNKETGDKKWEGMIKEAADNGNLKDTKECQQIILDMFMWENLLPDHMKKLVLEKYNEIEDKVVTGELEFEKGYEIYKEFEHKMLMKHTKEMEEAGPPKFDETSVVEEKKDKDDPPGEGPVLRWETRVVFVPGSDSSHPKNRKVKLAVTVKELGLTKYQFRRLRELVGKRYNSGKDELTIISERFEDREENRKDCLRTLFGLIEEAGKADELVDDARTGYVKTELQADPKFMEILNAKIMKKNLIRSVPGEEQFQSQTLT